MPPCVQWSIHKCFEGERLIRSQFGGCGADETMLRLQAAIRKELNEFKSSEMEVHEDSRIYTRSEPNNSATFTLDPLSSQRE